MARDIEDLVWKHDISYMDAIIKYADNKQLDIEVIGEALKSNSYITSQIEIEAENLHYLKKTSRLPM